MLQATQAIERQLGRDHKTVNGQYTDRTIDIDLIRAFDENGHEICYKSGTLTIPHPLWEQREFVRVPLEQIVTTNIN
jgi:2-amino-4-hydroxy-6-hydroxymethyldihydropteridine diphosphokinase